MKSICVLTIAAMVFLAAAPNAIATITQSDVVTEYQQTIHVVNRYNAYGVAIEGANTTTTITETEITYTDDLGDDDDDTFETWEVKTTTTDTNVVESSWHAGSLKTDTVTRTSETVDDKDDFVLSHTNYRDNHDYNEDGYLKDVSGGGSTYSVQRDKDGNITGGTEGTITRRFSLKDGQAVLASQTTSGNIHDKDFNSANPTDASDIGDFNNTSMSSDFVYLGGSWYAATEVSTSTNEYEIGTNQPNGNSDTTTRTTTYARDDSGVITGITQRATGSRTVINADKPGAGGLAQGTYTMQNYAATYELHDEMGFYLAVESYDWKLVESPTRNALETEAPPFD